MATITARPFVRHLSATPTMHVTHTRRGVRRHDGAGQAFWPDSCHFWSGESFGAL